MATGDPSWDSFGLPRLFTDAEAVDYFLKLADDPYNCLTLCASSLNANPDHDRAPGVMYLLGVWDMPDKLDAEKN